MGIKTFLPNHKNHYNPMNHSSDNFPYNPMNHSSDNFPVNP